VLVNNVINDLHSTKNDDFYDDQPNIPQLILHNVCCHLATKNKLNVLHLLTF